MTSPSKTGFDFDAIDVDDYEQLRPSYAPDSVRWLVAAARLSPADRIADIAAGTGKLTRLLEGAGPAVTALEPSRSMRTLLRLPARELSIVAAVAESLPIGNGAFACACVAQAFHHFDFARALPELRRTIAPGGHLALFWNVYDPADPLKRAMSKIVDRHIDPRWPAAAFGDWRAALADQAGFESSASRSFDHPHRLPAKCLAPLLLTSADIASRPVDVRRAFEQEVEALAATLSAEIAIRAATRVDLYRRTV